MRMKRTNKSVGLTGAGMILLGLALVWYGVAVAKSNPNIALPLLFGSSFLYIMGGMLAVSYYDFRRGSPTYLWIMLSRMTYAAAAVLIMVRSAGG